VDRAPSWPAPVEAGDGAWTRINPFPLTGPIQGFWGPAADDVWAWANWKIIHWDGRTWSLVQPPPEGGEVTAVGGLPHGIWVELQVHLPDEGTECNIIEAHDELRVWQRTYGGWNYIGSRANLSRAATKPEAQCLDADHLARLWSRHEGDRTVPKGVVMATACRVGGGDVWAADLDGRWMSRFDGTRWTSGSNPGWAGAHAIWFASETDGWAVSSHDISHWDGARWTTVREGFTGAWAMWGSAPDDVWVVGSKVPLHWDGAR
jgi:hypothetical protein